MEDLRNWLTLAVTAFFGIIGGLLSAIGFAVRQDRRISKVEQTVEKLSASPALAQEFSDRLTRVEANMTSHARHVDANFENMTHSINRLHDKLDRVLTSQSGR